MSPMHCFPPLLRLLWPSLQMMTPTESSASPPPARTPSRAMEIEKPPARSETCRTSTMNLHTERADEFPAANLRAPPMPLETSSSFSSHWPSRRPNPAPVIMRTRPQPEPYRRHCIETSPSSSSSPPPPTKDEGTVARLHH